MRTFSIKQTKNVRQRESNDWQGLTYLRCNRHGVFGRSGFTLAKGVVLSALVPAGASVLDARKEKRRERCALCELNLLVNMKQNQNPKLQNKKTIQTCKNQNLQQTLKHKTIQQILILRAQPASG
jgi:hypothetical protein